MRAPFRHGASLAPGLRERSFSVLYFRRGSSAPVVVSPDGVTRYLTSFIERFIHAAARNRDSSTDARCGKRAGAGENLRARYADIRFSVPPRERFTPRRRRRHSLAVDRLPPAPPSSEEVSAGNATRRRNDEIGLPRGRARRGCFWKFPSRRLPVVTSSSPPRNLARSIAIGQECFSRWSSIAHAGRKECNVNRSRRRDGPDVNREPGVEKKSWRIDRRRARSLSLSLSAEMHFRERER